MFPTKQFDKMVPLLVFPMKQNNKMVYTTSVPNEYRIIRGFHYSYLSGINSDNVE